MSKPLPPKLPFELPPPPAANSDLVVREGLAWLVHLNSGHESAEDWKAFETWQNWDDEHKRAAKRAKLMWEQVGTTLTRQSRPGKSKLPVIIMMTMIGLAGAGFAGGLAGPPAAFFADYQSSTGEVRTVTLADGSQVDLDTGTSFDVSHGGRTITLQSGQVFVTVKPGNPTPFVVVAGNTRAEALGTAYAVRKNGDDALVVVSESKVRVSRDGQKGGVVVAAGQAVETSAGVEPRQPYAADIKDLMAWRQGELRFTGRPLADVVAEADRYRRGTTVIFGDNIRTLPVTGTVDISDVDAFFASLEAALPIKVIRMPGLVAIMPDSAR
ncbi:MAG: FecR domain-containing protein [Pseudolabrys sp.]|nr:FecR domain-containing protein [Pseudolabrys sp.]